MRSSPSRRGFLRIGSVATTGLLAGCLLDNPEVSGGHLFVENRTAERRRVAVTVRDVSEEDAAPIVEGEYRIPGFYAIQFEDVLESGNTYSVRVNQPGPAPDSSREVTVQTCGEADDAGQLDASAILTDSGPGFATWSCDDDYTYREKLTYADASEFASGTDTPNATGTPGVNATGTAGIDSTGTPEQGVTETGDSDAAETTEP